MKRIFYLEGLLVLLFIGINVNISAQSDFGKISGTVITDDNKIAEGVTVDMVGTGYSDVTNELGKFSFNKLSAGEYTLRVSLVGHEDIDKVVTVSQGKSTQVTIRLTISALSLSEVVVTGYRNGLNAHTASGSLRTQTPLLELPQNIQVVTAKVLADQQVISMSDGLIRNVSGAVRLEHWGDLYTNISMRGSQIQAFRNGFNMVASYWGPLTEDMSFVDRIEFVKGPAGFMLSSGDPAGLYNIVTKKPTGETKGEASLMMGSYNLYRSTLDLDGRLSKDGKLLYRLNLAAQNKKSHRDFEYNNRYSVAPVISYQINDKTKITGEYTYQFAKMTDVGSYYVFAPGKEYATLPRDFTMTAPGLEPTKITDQTFLVNFEHQISADWKLTAQAVHSTYRHQGTSSWPSVVNADGTLQRGISIWDAASDMTLGQLFVNGNVRTGKIMHRILGGIDMGAKDYMADWGQYYIIDSANGGEFDPANPNYGVPSNGYPVWDRTTNLEARAVAAGGIMNQRYSSAYIQDELGFFDNQLRFTLAGRYTDLSQAAWGAAPDKAKKVTPRIGLSWSIDKTTSLYALYDQAFIPQTGRLSGGGKVQPITGNNQEIGIKKDWAKGLLSTTLSVYRILKENELTADPNEPPTSGLSVELGQKVARGFEFDVRGALFPGFTAIANYAFTEARVTKVSPGVTVYKVGDDLRGYAGHTVNSWLAYKIQQGALKNSGITGGFTWLMDRKTDNWSSVNIGLPDYFKLDGGLFWENSNIRVSANVFNILDKYLYSGSYYEWLNAVYWQTEPGRNARLQITFKF